MSDTKHVYTFIRGSVWTVFLSIILGVLNYALRKTLSVYLPFNMYGFVYAIISLAMLILAYLDLGFSQSATILMSKSLADGKTKDAFGTYNWLFFIKLVFGLVIWLIIVSTSSFWLNDFFHFNSFWIFFWLSSLILVQAFAGAPTAVLSSLQKFATSSTMLLIVPVSFLILFYILINFFNASILSAILFPSCTFIAYLFSSSWIRKFGFKIKFSYLKTSKSVSTILHTSKWIAISSAGLTTMYYLDSLTLSYFKGTESVALYNIALPIMQIVQGFFVFLNVFIPIATELWHKGEKEKIAQICRIVTTISVWFFWPVLIFIIIFGKYLIIFLFSSKYIEAYTALVILFYGNVFFGIASFYIGVLNATEDIKLVAITMISGCILNLVLNIILVPMFGIVGASLATVITYKVISVVFFVILRKKLNESILIKSYFIISCIAGIISLAVVIYFVEHSFINALVIFIISMLIYAIVTSKISLELIKTSLYLFKSNVLKQ